MKSLDLAAAATVITGAANGIGAALAAEFASAGAALALVDIDGAGLERTADAARRAGARVTTHIADLADASAFPELTERLLAEHAAIGCLVNNAGAGLFGSVEALTIEEMARLLDINFWSGVRLTKGLLPHLLTQPTAQIVFIGSVLGLIALPFQAPYVASKFAVRGFAEALRLELASTGVGVTLVVPGGVATGIEARARVAAAADPAQARHEMARYARHLTLTPEAAARRIVAAVRSRRPRLLLGRDAVRADALQRVLPAAYPTVLARAARRRAAREDQ